MARKVTRRMAEKVISNIDAQYGVDHKLGGGPELLEDWDGRDFVVVWEGGPHDWPMFISGGGFDEWGNEYKPTKMPVGLWCEPVNGSVLALYRI